MFDTKRASEKVKKDIKELSKKSTALYKKRDRVEKLTKRAEKKLKSSKEYKKLNKRIDELTEQYCQNNIKLRKAQDVLRALAALNDTFEYKGK